MSFIEHCPLEQCHIAAIPTLCMLTHPSLPDILFNSYLPLTSITDIF